MPSKPPIVRYVVTWRFANRYWLGVDCQWCRLFNLRNGCMACGPYWSQVGLAVGMDDFRRRCHAAAVKSQDLGKLLEFLRDLGIKADLE